MPIRDSTLQKLRDIAGPEGYLDRPADIAPFLVDFRQLYHGATPLVLRPASTAQVAALLKICHQYGVGVVPVGGNTSYCGGATPSADNDEVVISMARMRQVRHIDPLNYALVAEAGCVLADIHAAADAADRLFPLSLGSEGSCQLGGNLSTNAGGTAVLHYGMMRDLVLGLEIVLPDGAVIDGLKALRKDNTGYDWRNLFIGAEGTLGIITAAALKLYPRPVSTATALIAVRDPAAAVTLLASLKSFTGDCITTFELMPRLALELVFKHVARTADPFERRYEWYVLAEATTPRNDERLRSWIETALEQALAQERVFDAVFAESSTQRAGLWRIREHIPEAQKREGASIKHDISVTTPELPPFIVEATAAVLNIAPQARIIPYGHLGDGNLHFNVSEPLAGDRSAFESATAAINRAVHDLVAKYRGSISAEHGIGRLKRDELAHYKSQAELDLMRSIKHAIDPKGIMNPGKVL
jgi:FAD/FMN-containing dehydrogenase